MRFVLASASPARLATLRRAGVHPEVIVSGVDEDAISADSPAQLVQVLADAKAEAVASQLLGQLLDQHEKQNCLVLGCDSLLELDGISFGKPASAAAAIQLWHQLRGRSGVLHTGHALIDLASGQRVGRTASTVVYFTDATDAEIEHYVATSEPLRVAGGFTLDGLGGWFVEGVQGDHHNVVGLSLPLLRRMLAEVGAEVRDLPASSDSAG